MEHFDSHYRNKGIDYKEVYNNIVNGLSEYILKNNLKAMVLGISGGLDSTVCASICKVVANKIDVPLICVSMPCNSNKGDENSSARAACNEFASQAIFYNIEEEYQLLSSHAEEMLPANATPISNGNIKARLRMIHLYDIASRTRGIVIDTDNITENLLGFYTIHGDMGDLNPIGSLWKTEVYGLAKWMLENVYPNSDALKKAIEITPTDGNVGGSDMDQIMPNHTYEDIDCVLSKWALLDSGMKDRLLKYGFKGTTFEELFKKYGEDVVMGVIRRNLSSRFKRVHGPIVINAFTSKIEDKEGRVINA